MKKTIFSIAIMGFALNLFSACCEKGECKAKTEVPAQTTTTQSIKADVVKAEKAAKTSELKIREDFDKALADAEKEGKILMLHFSGSDWCPPCKALHKLVIDTKEFKKYANEKLTYVLSDWDKMRMPKSKDFAKQHAALIEQLQIEGFPTIVLINPKTKKAEKLLGVPSQTPEGFIEQIELFKEKSK